MDKKSDFEFKISFIDKDIWQLRMGALDYLIWFNDENYKPIFWVMSNQKIAFD